MIGTSRLGGFAAPATTIGGYGSYGSTYGGFSGARIAAPSISYGNSFNTVASPVTYAGAYGVQQPYLQSYPSYSQPYQEHLPVQTVTIPHSNGKFVIGEQVSWTKSDDDIQEGSVGSVIGFTKDRVRVRFEGHVDNWWDFKDEELNKVEYHAPQAVYAAAPTVEQYGYLQPAAQVTEIDQLNAYGQVVERDFYVAPEAQTFVNGFGEPCNEFGEPFAQPPQIFVNEFGTFVNEFDQPCNEFGQLLA